MNELQPQQMPMGQMDAQRALQMQLQQLAQSGASQQQLFEAQTAGERKLISKYQPERLASFDQRSAINAKLMQAQLNGASPEQLAAMNKQMRAAQAGGELVPQQPVGRNGLPLQSAEERSQIAPSTFNQAATAAAAARNTPPQTLGQIDAQKAQQSAPWGMNVVANPAPQAAPTGTHAQRPTGMVRPQAPRQPKPIQQNAGGAQARVAPMPRVGG